MRDFEGRWQVLPAAAGAGHDKAPASGESGLGGGGGGGESVYESSGGGGRARVEHVLAVKPLMPIPPAVARFTQGIFTRQVANILRDLEREIAAKSAAAPAAAAAAAAASPSVR
jgi:hypothetical protein